MDDVELQLQKGEGMIQNRVLKNASWLIACRIAQSAISLIIGMLTARYLGPSNYGLISYAASLVAFVVPVMQLGLSNILVHETVEHPEQEGKVYGTAIALSLVSSLACIMGLFTFVAVVNRGQTETIVVCVLYSILLIFQAIELIQYWFQAKLLSKYIAIVSLCAYVLVATYKVFLLATQKNIYWFTVSNAIDYMVIAFALLAVYKKLGGQKLDFSWAVAKRMLNSSRYYIVSSMMVTIFAQTDKIMLTLMIGETATGYYSAAVTCAGVTSFVFVAIIDSMRTQIFESRIVGKKEFELDMSRLYCIVTYLSIAQSLFMTLFARPMILLLYGEEYTSAIPALRIVVWYSTFSYFGSVRNIWILAEQKQKYLWIINLSGALANVILNAILIPVWGLMGAAFASLVTQIFTNVIIGFILKPIRPNNRLMLKGLSVMLILNLIFKKKNDY